MTKNQRPKDSRPAPVGDFLRDLPGAGVTQSGSFGPAAELAAQARDAEREPDFAGPDGPARFSRRPGVHADVEAPADAATGQPAASTLPSPAELPPLSAGLAVRLAKHCAVQLDPMWFERLQKLADRAGLDPSRFVEELIKQKWVLGPMAHPAPR